MHQQFGGRKKFTFILYSVWTGIIALSLMAGLRVWYGSSPRPSTGAKLPKVAAFVNPSAPTGPAQSSKKDVRSGAGPFSLEHQHPTSRVLYAGNPSSITPKRLPANVMRHLFGGSLAANDPFARCVVTDCGDSINDDRWGYLVWGSHGNYASGQPIYFATANDPWYIVKGCLYCPPGWSVKFHAPSNAWWQLANDTGQGGDNHFGVWDQATNLMVQLYGSWRSDYTQHQIGPCPGGDPYHAGSEKDPCPITGFSGAAASDFDTARDWDASYKGKANTMSSLGMNGAAGIVRVNEIIEGVIPHATLGVVRCINAPNGAPLKVFPATPYGPLPCPSTYQRPDRPYEGMLVFADYTDAQLDCMNPAKPACKYSDNTTVPKVLDYQMTFITQLTHYGQYVAETGGSKYSPTTLIPYNQEDSDTAWTYAGKPLGSPLWDYWQSKGIDCANRAGKNPSARVCRVHTLRDIPLMSGPGSADANGRLCASVHGCDFSGHVHIADPCVSRALAGQTVAKGACP